MTNIPEFSCSESIETLTQALAAAGCLVLHGAQSTQVCQTLRTELAPYMDAAPVQEDKPGDFYPGQTRRISALMARSETSRSMACNPVVANLCEHHFANHCDSYNLHVTAALDIGPGARKQILHREEDPFEFFPLPRPNLVLATMWAISDFSKDNGGTLLVPGSHRWTADRQPTAEEVVAAEMPAGSALVWLGGTLHAAGANISDRWRYGVILSYSLGWLRQEENQYLDCPPPVADKLSPELRKLLGYPMHGALGFYDPSISAG